MIVILHPPDCRTVAESIAADLTAAFKGHVSVSLISADSSSPWPSTASWDDLLLVVHDGKAFPDPGNTFIVGYSSARANARLLPIALDLAHRKPPTAVAAIKALEYDDSAKGKTGRLIHRAGCMLGLRMQGRDSKIFISYRATDGKAIAEQIYARFLSLGHSPYRDEAKDFDGDTKILPGEAVQQQIDAALADASLVLLLDTPSAPSSIWIKHEVDTADAQLLPTLPVQVLDERKDLLLHMRQHFLRLHLLEVAPAKVALSMGVFLSVSWGSKYSSEKRDVYVSPVNSASC